MTTSKISETEHRSPKGGYMPIDRNDYGSRYQRTVRNPDWFFAETADFFHSTFRAYDRQTKPESHVCPPLDVIFENIEDVAAAMKHYIRQHNLKEDNLPFVTVIRWNMPVAKIHYSGRIEFLENPHRGSAL